MAEKKTDGLYRESGTLVLVADGVEYVVKPLDWQNDFTEMERQYAAQMMAPEDALIKKFDKLSASPALQDKLVQLAYRDMRLKADADKPTREEVGRWLDTREGLTCSLHLQLGKTYLNMTKETATEIIGKALMAESMKRGIARDASLKLLMEARDLANEPLVKVANAAANAPPDSKLEALAAAGVKGDELIRRNVDAPGPTGETVPPEQKG